MLDTQNISKSLKPIIGEIGLEYLSPLMQVMRAARALPKNVEDEPLITARFYEALRLIEAWIDPLHIIMEAELGDLEKELLNLQGQAQYLIGETRSWYDILHHENPRVPALLNEIKERKAFLLKRRLELFQASTRDKITNLLGLVLYPYNPKFRTLNQAIKYAETTYYGPNIRYRRANKYADALIFVKAAEELMAEKKEIPTDAKVGDFSKFFKEISAFDPEMSKIQDIYLEAKQGNFAFIGLTMKQVQYIVTRVLKRQPTPNERSLFNTEFYMDAIDKYRVDKVLEWVTKQLRSDTEVSAPKVVEPSKAAKGEKQNYLFGLSFLDKHKNQEILGNIPESAFNLMEAVLSIFHELKQSQAFMEAAGFELTTQIYGLPEQAWLYDFTSVKTEILRSTMLLLADRVPKFDLLEACQQLATAVLSGRVDRDDLRITEPGDTHNYIRTKLLPRDSWNYIAETLINILEEAMVKEEDRAARIIKHIFREEDRSHLVTSKKFMPVYFMRLKHDHKYNPLSITLFVAEGFDFQYRHAQVAGYPWYFDENKLFQSLVQEALKKDIPSQALQLRKVISNIDGEKFIFYYEVNDKTLMTLAFKEVPEFTEGLTPVEVLFRPKKFMTIYSDENHHQNNLVKLLSEARATDPKDLEALISNL
ncbi:MAG: hypothetical protein D6813_09925 [Calditrichaeota bacterium]|nr:MAG: hypothetical protein D6813_09925 [Calditrichota bacterium]